MGNTHTRPYATDYKPKMVRYTFKCVCGLTSVDDSQEPFRQISHKGMLKMGFKYRKFKDGTRYYLMLEDISKQENAICECYT